mmetsp:Transcript_30541/g.71008  ORF Transcript_30541/g.71008 Transcript_30541/m.71008 type:complete len:935 (-) Transcript_30541:267-3071(-)
MEEPSARAAALHTLPRRRKNGASRAHVRRMLPVLLVGVFCLYGVWFTNAAAQHSADLSPAASPPDAREPPVLTANLEAQSTTSAVGVVRSEATGGAAAVNAAASALSIPEGGQRTTAATRIGGTLEEPPAAVGTAASAGVAAPMGAAASSCDTGMAPAPAGGAAYVGDFSGASHLSVNPLADIERESMSVSAWVHLDKPSSSGEIMSIQTIVANKHSGCGVDADHHGFSVFINEWNTNAEQLYVSWGNDESGCEELATDRGSAPAGKWLFVTAVFDKSDAALYIDGKLHAHSGRGIGRLRTVRQPPTPIERQRRAGGALRIGVHPDLKHALRGFLGELAIFPAALTDEQVLRLYSCGSPMPPLLKLEWRESGPALSDSAERGVAQLVDALSKSSTPAPVATASAGGRHTRPTYSMQDPLSLVDSTSASHTAFEAPHTRLRRQEDTSGRSSPPSQGWPLPWLANRAPANISAEARAASDKEAAMRVEHVRNAFKRAWSAYRQYAWGADEVKPISNRSHNWLHMGATMIDALDNLWIFGMKDEFVEAQEWVATQLSLKRAVGISMFETVIRILGGLLSAFELSREPVFLSKAQEVADHMMYAFDANPKTGLPCTTISFANQRQCQYPSWAGHAAILAEYGTIQLEFKYLAHHTKQKKYWDVAERPMRLLQGLEKPHGLYPTFINPQTGRWSSQKFTFGALADSFYEYLIKQWLITNKKEEYLRKMFDDAMIGMAKLLVQKSSPSGLVYIADWTGSSIQHKMDHLACFAGAMLAIGAQDGYAYDKEYMSLAYALGDTCYEMYARTQTGLSPEFVQFVSGRDMQTPRTACFNIGRPEAVETFFVLWYYTRDPKWRDIGWEVFKAFEQHAATGSGWAALSDVENPKKKRDDKMESFVLAETMKYLFLLFSNDDPIPLEKYVMNTEAHPLGRFEPMATNT